ncbi:hypothetical protein L596_016022 [Steinernema carpocapsae]|uniref:Protein kinase domain-containing protein n=1 Tax=Steinernema carpocapsae TaxID=34508 RepID=A0A4U5NHK1_STECR|nr:hypothetical protein L596_016022 [Steinernema carpocapsae]
MKTLEAALPPRKETAAEPNFAAFGNVGSEFVERKVLLEKGDFCLWKDYAAGRVFSVRCDDDSFLHLRLRVDADGELWWFDECPDVKLSNFADLVKFFDYGDVNLFQAYFGKSNVSLRHFKNARNIEFSEGDAEVFLHGFLGRFDNFDLYKGSVYNNSAVKKATVKRMLRNDEERAAQMIKEFNTLQFLAEKLENEGIQRMYALRFPAERNSALLAAYGEAEAIPAKEFIGSNKWKKLTEKERIEMALDLVTTLADMRNVGVLHANLGVDAIAVKPDGRFLVVDFARAIRVEIADELQNVRLQTEAWGPMDSSAFAKARNLAPEMLQTKAFSVASEVYALALFLAEFFAGRSPFGGKSDTEVTAAFLQKTLRPEIQLAHGRLEIFLKRCCSEKPENRPNFKGIYEALCEMKESARG